MSLFWISSYYVQIQALLSCLFVGNNMEQYQRETKLQMEIALLYCLAFLSLHIPPLHVHS